MTDHMAHVEGALPCSGERYQPEGGCGVNRVFIICGMLLGLFPYEPALIVHLNNWEITGRLMSPRWLGQCVNIFSVMTANVLVPDSSCDKVRICPRHTLNKQ